VEVFTLEALLVAQHQVCQLLWQQCPKARRCEAAVTAITVPHGRQRLHHAVCLSKW